MSAYNIGDIDNGLEIDKILKMAHRYSKYSAGDCLSCWAAKVCGVCFSHAVRNNDFDINRKREYCKQSLASKHNDLVIYATIMEQNPRAFDFANEMVII